MPFASDDITPEPEWKLTPEPERIAHWWRVNLGAEPGWAWVPAWLPPPPRSWVARELTRLETQLGADLEHLLRAPSGMQLEHAPGLE